MEIFMNENTNLNSADELERLSKLGSIEKPDLSALSDAQCLQLAINLYDEMTPVSDIMELTGVTRTRLYNNLRKRGKNPNRQSSNVKAEAEQAIQSYKNEANELREQLGVLKYLLERKEVELADLRQQLKQQ